MKSPMAFLAALVALCCIASTAQCRSLKHELNRPREVSRSSRYDSVKKIAELGETSRFGLPNILNNTLNSSRGNSRRRNLHGYEASNPIDECWRGDANWGDNRLQLAECAIGYGSDVVGGKNGKIYTVTDPGDDEQEPAPGTLRYGVIQLTPLWIVFERDMVITLKNELIVTSDKTIDGRGAKVEIAYGPCITIQDVSNVIIHGLSIHDCKPGAPAIVRSSTAHIGQRVGSDGDGITVFAAENVWIDHNTFSSCADGLVDVIRGSTAITISNNVFTNHDKVMLLGHDDNFMQDKGMKVTVAYNRFGPGCVQRMPRCRLGYFHVVNNDYLNWEMYAIGGSADPTIISQGNRFQAPNNPDAKEVTKRDCSCNTQAWSEWTWQSENDVFLNGAFFVESGSGQAKPVYGSSLAYPPSSFVPSLTSHAGALLCSPNLPC